MSTDTHTHPFAFEYHPGAIRYGSGITTELAAELDRLHRSRALVVCGSTVGSTPAVIDPVREGLGDRLIGVFDRTTPEKYLATAVQGAKLMRERDIDVLVSLGGGSSLDTAKIMSGLAAHDGSIDDVAATIIEREVMSFPDTGTSLTPLIAIPTTLAGADLSIAAGVNLSLHPSATPNTEIPSSGVSDPRLMPTALFYDPKLFATTPEHVLTASAMNGFDKGIEVLYAKTATPITDATAMRGLRLLRAGLPALADADGVADGDALRQVVTGIILVQYGASTPTTNRLSIIHAFGHGFARRYEISQGAVHGIVAPHVLQYLFDKVYAGRDLLAEALSGQVAVDNQDKEAVAAIVVDQVTMVRDALALPSQLRVIDGLEKNHLSEIAGAILEDSFMTNVPPGSEPTAGEVETLLNKAW
jgi:alcohol dehydrogenase class IV